MSHSGRVEKTPDLETDGTEYHLPEHHAPLPELSHAEKPHGVASNAEFVAMADSPEYKKLRSTFTNFAFPMTIAALVAYFTYVVLSIYAVDFMSQPFLGFKGFNLGIALGLLQFAIVWVFTAIYVNFNDKKIDPISAALKAKLEKGATA